SPPGAHHLPPLPLRSLRNPPPSRILPDPSETAGGASPGGRRRRSRPAAALPLRRARMPVREAARTGAPAAPLVGYSRTSTSSRSTDAFSPRSICSFRLSKTLPSRPAPLASQPARASIPRNSIAFHSPFRSGGTVKRQLSFNFSDQIRIVTLRTSPTGFSLKRMEVDSWTGRDQAFQTSAPLAGTERAPSTAVPPWKPPTPFLNFSLKTSFPAGTRL